STRRTSPRSWGEGRTPPPTTVPARRHPRLVKARPTVEAPAPTRPTHVLLRRHTDGPHGRSGRAEPRAAARRPGRARPTDAPYPADGPARRRAGPAAPDRHGRRAGHDDACPGRCGGPGTGGHPRPSPRRVRG